MVELTQQLDSAMQGFDMQLHATLQPHSCSSSQTVYEIDAGELADRMP